DLEPEDYQRRFGVDPTGWPVLPHRSSHSQRPHLNGAVARDSLLVTLRGSPEQVAFFKELCHSDPPSAVQFSRALGAMPEAGTDFLGFHLIAELGRGAFGKVFLARQGELADRPVALKISSDIRGESRTLAQLQHTNIVPIYSVHHASPFHAVCMPFLG